MEVDHLFFKESTLYNVSALLFMSFRAPKINVQRVLLIQINFDD